MPAREVEVLVQLTAREDEVLVQLTAREDEVLVQLTTYVVWLPGNEIVEWQNL